MVGSAANRRGKAKSTCVDLGLLERMRTMPLSHQGASFQRRRPLPALHLTSRPRIRSLRAPRRTRALSPPERAPHHPAGGPSSPLTASRPPPFRPSRLHLGRRALTSTTGGVGALPSRWTGTRPRVAPIPRIQSTRIRRPTPPRTDDAVMILTSEPGGSTMPRSAPPTRARALFLVLLSLLVTVPALGLVMTAGGEAEAHGAPMKPGSRTFLCWQDGLTAGEIKPNNPRARARRRAAPHRSTTGSRCCARTAPAAPGASSRTASCAAAATPTSPASTLPARTGR